MEKKPLKESARPTAAATKRNPAASWPFSKSIGAFANPFLAVFKFDRRFREPFFGRFQIRSEVSQTPFWPFSKSIEGFASRKKAFSNSIGGFASRKKAFSNSIGGLANRVGHFQNRSGVAQTVWAIFKIDRGLHKPCRPFSNSFGGYTNRVGHFQIHLGVAQTVWAIFKIDRRFSHPAKKRFQNRSGPESQASPGSEPGGGILGFAFVAQFKIEHGAEERA